MYNYRARTWRNPHMLIEREFKRIEKLTQKMRFDRTGIEAFIVFEAYCQHKIDYAAQLVAERRSKLEHTQIDREAAAKAGRRPALALGGKKFADGRLGVLGLPTVFAPHWTPTEYHPQALWPCPKEFKEEGDERHTSNYGRFFPIPRVPGNPTVVYKQKKFCPTEVMDMMMSVPKYLGMENSMLYGFHEIEVDIAGIPVDDGNLSGSTVYLCDVPTEIRSWVPDLRGLPIPGIEKKNHGE